MSPTPRPVSSSDPISRRAALQRLAVAVAGVAVGPRDVSSAVGPDPAVKHPDPRPGLTADGVLPDENVPEKSKKAYAAAREIPEILDGLYCHCDCGERDGLRSLFSCFESKMPFSCMVCRGEAELAHELHKAGKTLAEIRVAIDKRYG